jgi:hypothetical protein
MLSTFTTIFTLLPALYNRNVECYPLLQQYLPCYLLYIIEMLALLLCYILELVPENKYKNIVYEVLLVMWPSKGTLKYGHKTGGH